MIKQLALFIFATVISMGTALADAPAPTYLISVWAGNQPPDQDKQTLTYSTRTRERNINRSQICVQGGHTGQLTFTRTVPAYDIDLGYRRRGALASENDRVLVSYFKMTPTPALKKHHVQLQVAMQTAMNTQTNAQQQLTTTVTLHEDRWEQLTGNHDNQDNTETYTTQARPTGIVNYYVRVEEVDDCSE